MIMPNTFPQLLDYSFYAPTILRVAAALVFAYLAYQHYSHLKEISHVHFPVVGQGVWIGWAMVIVETVVALGLFLGYHTQINAIIGAIVALKHVVWGARYPHIFMLSKSSAFLLLMICLSLLLSSAGRIAFDVFL